MSKLGNIQKSFGEQIQIAVANTTSDIVLNSKDLPGNTLIIASPTNKEGDVGSYSLLITDIYGEPVRLTYCFAPGNGLRVDNDILYLSIDKSTIKDNNGLSVNIDGIIDNNTLYKSKTEQITINQDNLTSASSSELGLVKIDGYTLKLNADNQLYVDTQNLNKASNDVYGIVTSDNKTIDITDDGVMSVNVLGLDIASNENYGIVKIDEKTLVNTNNGITVNAQNLRKCSEDKNGLIRVDGNTLISNDGIISVATENLPNTSEDTFGIAQYDGLSIQTHNGVASVNNKLTDIDIYNSKVNELEELLEKLQNLIAQGGNSSIRSASFNTSAAFDLAKPSYGDAIITMPMQYVYISINVITTVDFRLDVDFINNINPAAELVQVVYNNKTYKGDDILTHIFESTNNRQQRLILLVNCKNFNGTKLSYSQQTKVNITLSNADNTALYKKLTYSIIRYNSAINPNDVLFTNGGNKIDVIYTVSNADSKWSYIKTNDKIKMLEYIKTIGGTYKGDKWQSVLYSYTGDMLVKNTSDEYTQTVTSTVDLNVINARFKQHGRNKVKSIN